MHEFVRRSVSMLFIACVFFHRSCSVAADAQQVPPQLNPPSDQRPLLQVHAKGDQIYTCKQDGAQFSWTLKAPEARLFIRTARTRTASLSVSILPDRLGKRTTAAAL